MTRDLYSASKNDSEIRDILEYAKVKQIMIAPNALFELEENNYKEIIDSASNMGLFVLPKEYVVDWKRAKSNLIPIDEKAKDVIVLPQKMVEIQKTKEVYAKQIDSDLVIRKDLEVSDKESTSGSVSEFRDFFLERFKTLSKILQKRPHLTPVTSEYLRKKANKNEEVIMIGMLNDKNLTKNGNIMLSFDDEEGQFSVVVTQKNEKLFDVAKNIVIDDVVAIKGTKLGDNLVICNEIDFPDLPQRSFKKCTRDVYAAAISDIHIGSKVFFKEEFQKFIDWLKMRNTDSKDEEIVSRIKYLFVAGDIVDGIGVYPQHFDELDIYDIYEQFDVVADFFEQIPEHIEIIMGCGNHDPVRLADPQPAIPKEYAKRLYDMKNVHFVGSPAWAEVEGQKVLMYHGNSMFSLQLALNLDATKPEEIMREMLIRRDLASQYGTRHPILPEKGGYLLIKEEPDIFITGHIHHNGYDNYKGCVLVNPGTWQGQTIYQLDQGHVPTPGRVPIIKLNCGKINEKVFIDGSTKM